MAEIAFRDGIDQLAGRVEKKPQLRSSAPDRASARRVSPVLLGRGWLKGGVRWAFRTLSGQRRPDDFQILAKLLAGKLILCIRNPSLLNFLQHFFQVVPVCPGLGQSQKTAEKKFDEPTSLRNSRLARIGDRGTGTTSEIVAVRLHQGG